MTTVKYISQPIKKAIVKLARQKFGIKSADDIGMIVTDVITNEYTKGGIEITSHSIDFILFDNTLKKIGVLKRNQFKTHQHRNT